MPRCGLRELDNVKYLHLVLQFPVSKKKIKYQYEKLWTTDDGH